MYRQEINITSLKKSLPKMLDLVAKGEEFIITKSNIPIAKITPIQPPTFSVKDNISISTARAIKNRMDIETNAPEYWFG
jgi:antitoxin (DNA-binding transcriptional repressor) of toxin-antitoxin stability system